MSIGKFIFGQGLDKKTGSIIYLTKSIIISVLHFNKETLSRKGLSGNTGTETNNEAWCR